ncbi:hypothetical protein [Streptomyces sp. NPDC001250]|uniref:hypothetical protein n=1 Tax=unclassified Streptomyces TaxID=2593676 RepID=UPI00332A6B75
MQSRDQCTVRLLGIDPADGRTTVSHEQRDARWVELVRGRRPVPTPEPYLPMRIEPRRGTSPPMPRVPKVVRAARPVLAVPSYAESPVLGVCRSLPRLGPRALRAALYLPS